MTDKSYKINAGQADIIYEQMIGNFVKHHRLLQNRTQQQVADAANISRSTLSLLEKGETVTLATLIKVLRILDKLSALASFELPNMVSPLLIAKMAKDKRKRARPKVKSDQPKSNW